jgi:hypothetical protein
MASQRISRELGVRIERLCQQAKRSVPMLCEELSQGRTIFASQLRRDEADKAMALLRVDVRKMMIDREEGFAAMAKRQASQLS